ncbi:PadR family transcriptional regulator [Actinoplanes sp. DH11]|uniref:PadR family transcriptional regulator n=1 Tax=Actinoplanes sp. DH11 TaxID=2857011 RepID=UPI001E4B1B0F|nr:PadR family transcriptional regulator [Actinoplanes sp. DH11]
MDGERWPSDWIRAALPLVVLSVLRRGPAHGYVLLQSLQALGLGSLRGSTLYPLLARQEELGRVEHRWEPDSGGPPRKVFSITEAGRRDLAALSQDWSALHEVVMTAVAGVAAHGAKGER